ncbi:hypothetical protein NL676_008648 [Syzygium grande]|nr:hypothetical protein NL676_008648 [Syzygium grande]
MEEAAGRVRATSKSSSRSTPLQSSQGLFLMNAITHDPNHNRNQCNLSLLPPPLSLCLFPINSAATCQQRRSQILLLPPPDPSPVSFLSLSFSRTLSS